MRQHPLIDAMQYLIEVRPLPSEDGGGWLATFADLPGCMGDGETPEAAVRDGCAAASAWLVVAEEAGDPLPTPAGGGESGKFIARVPKSLHARLASCARTEGVSMNTLVVALLAEGAELRVG
ncbi:MAG: toxin-antitoxin system HicB family antitoxin [Xanthomonadaceae bacterium]|nr:toxin-antitoxin system HicB family antitoxin [Xanthomonadaceae bacterium]